MPSPLDDLLERAASRSSTVIGRPADIRLPGAGPRAFGNRFKVPAAARFSRASGKHSACLLQSALRLSTEIGNEFRRTQAVGVREVEQFHHVDPPLSAFDPRSAGLPTTGPVSGRRPGQLRVSSRPRQ
jgi:hypothetical protein